MTKIKTSLAAMVLLALGAPVQTQTQAPAEFEEAVAIIDTAILFAIGAREAEQALRGSFGWPTFQEGFVESVYFRFDPDGYARFSSSPRLDEDVFEVQCAAGSAACLAKKQGIDIGLTPEGRIQLRFPGITPNDTFFVSDRKTELPLPPSILEPLDARLETLLASGGELIIKRELEVIQRISLSGFSAVTTYLRWIAQQQSPRVFPRGWPVPAQSQVQNVSGLTQPNSWASGNAAPQVSQTTWDAQLSQRNQQSISGQQLQQRQLATNGGFLAPAPNTVAQTQLEANFRALQAEVELLRGQATQPPTSGIGSSWPQRQANPAQDQHSQSLDASQSFAEQARARNLQQPDPQFGQPNLQQNGQQGFNSQSGFSNWSQQSNSTDYGMQSEVMSAVRDVNERLQKLEYSLALFQREISAKLDVLGATSSIASTNAAPNWQGRPVQLQTLNLPSAFPKQNTPASESERLKALESLLMQRLKGAPNTSNMLPEISNATAPGTVNLDQSLVEDLLTSLDSAPASPEETPSAPTTDNTAKPEEFVTLSEYLNRVLKSESASSNDPSAN